jgi:hypothetical protein
MTGKTGGGILATVPSGPQEPISGGLISPTKAAMWLGVAPKVLERWRGAGGGPSFVRFNRKTIRYRMGDLEAFVASHVRATTAKG